MPLLWPDCCGPIAVARTQAWSCGAVPTTAAQLQPEPAEAQSRRRGMDYPWLDCQLMPVYAVYHSFLRQEFNGS